MALTFVAAGTAATAASGNVTPGLPAGIATDDILVLSLITRDNVVSTLPAGWTKFVDEDHPGSLIHLTLAWKKHTSGDAAPLVTHTAGNSTIAQVAAFRGVHLTTPVVTEGALYTSGASVSDIGAIAGITPGADGCAVVVVGGKKDDWTSVATLTGDSLTYNEIGEPDTTLGNDAGMVWDYALQTTAAAIAAKTFTVTGGIDEYAMGVMFALQPSTTQAFSGTATISGGGALVASGTKAVSAAATVPGGGTLAAWGHALPPGLQGWYRAHDIAQADASAVADWTDASGNARTLSQATGSAQPTYQTGELNGLPVVRFDGGDYLQCGSISDFIDADAATVFVVVRVTAATLGDATVYNNHGILGDDGGYWGFYASTNLGLSHYNYDGTTDKADQALTVDAWTRLEGRHESGSIYLRKDGGTDSSAASGNTSNVTGALRLGRAYSSGYLTGDIAEVLVYDRALTLGERDGVDDYLEEKYGTDRSGTAAISGGGALAASGIKGVSGAAILSGGGSLVASGTSAPFASGEATISGGGTITASGITERSGAGSISAGGLAAAEGVKAAAGTAAISGGGSLVASGFDPGDRWGTATLSGGGSLTASGVKALVPTTLAVRAEYPPDELALYVENSDGSIVRIAGDEGKLPLSDVTLGTTLPGGFATADGVAMVPDARDDLRPPGMFAPIVVMGPGREVAWEGRLDAPVERPSGGELRLQCVGHQAALEDHQGVVFLGCDNDTAAWQDPPRRRIKVGADSIRTTNALFTLENSEGGISLTMEPDREVKQQDRGEVWYLAPAGQKIVEVQYIGSEVQGTDMLPRIYRAVEPGASPTLIADMTLDLTIQKAVSSVGERYVFISDSSDSGQTKSARVVSLLSLTVFGDHGLPRSTIDETLPDGLRFSDVLEHLIEEYAPSLRTRYKGVTSISPSHYVMARAMWTDPTTLGQIIEEGIAFEPGREWAVWDNRMLHYQHRDHFGRTWKVRRSDGAEFIDTGETGSESYNGVIVSFEIGDGEPRRIGPPGSGADYEDSALADKDPNNPVNAAAHMGDRFLLVDSQSGSQAQALQVGQAALKDATRTRFTGEVQLPRYAECEGSMLPTWMLRAGDTIVDGDRRKEKELPVVGTSYQRGQLDRPMTATIDTPANRLDAAIARMTSTPEPHNIKKLTRKRHQANRRRRRDERKARAEKKNPKGGKKK